MIIENNSIENGYINLYSLTQEKIYLPIFQRGFSWKEEQTEKILENISTLLDNELVENKQLYLLDFIAFREDGKLKLADGQQRLVTLSILIDCFNYVALENGYANQIKNFDIEYDDVECQNKWYKMKNISVISPFKRVYLRLREFILEYSQKLNLIEKIIKNNIYVYLKMASNADDAFDIFEQINTGGKPLTKDEVINTIIKQYTTKYGITLSCGKKKLKDLLTSYYKFSSTPSTYKTFNSLAIMSFLDKHVIKSKESLEQFERYIQSAQKASDLPITYIVNLLNRNQLIDMIYAYEINGINLKTSRIIIDEVFIPICLLCIIFSLSGVSPGGKTKTFLNKIIEMIKGKNSTHEIKKYILDFADSNQDICIISLEDFTNALQGKSKQNILKALLLLDVIKSNTSGYFLPESINLEHIYPQNPVLTWGANGWPQNVDEQNLYIHNIGNFLILNERINKKIQNGYIDDKIVEYKRIIPNDKLLQTVTNTVNFEKFSKGKKYIIERQKEIAQYIQANFPCAKAFIR